jgi:hypothetical protein
MLNLNKNELISLINNNEIDVSIINNGNMYKSNYIVKIIIKNDEEINKLIFCKMFKIVKEYLDNIHYKHLIEIANKANNKIVIYEIKEIFSYVDNLLIVILFDNIINREIIFKFNYYEETGLIFQSLETKL